MHLFRVFTCHALATSMLILSMISAAPISTSWQPPESKKRLFSEFSVAEVDEAEESPKRPRGSYKYHDHANGSKAPLRKYYIVVCPQSKQKVESERYSDPKATWTVGFVQAEKESDLSGKILCGYRTVQTQPPAKPFAGEWEFVVDKNQPRKTGLRPLAPFHSHRAQLKGNRKLRIFNEVVENSDLGYHGFQQGVSVSSSF
ncbi:hypothetical protein F5880DRAFT_660310 [Lentinula raphanica]|nr:hypothetical protein F5880DRAFT_660310 [Lentinula raphanica]